MVIKRALDVRTFQDAGKDFVAWRTLGNIVSKLSRVRRVGRETTALRAAKSGRETTALWAVRLGRVTTALSDAGTEGESMALGLQLRQLP